MKPVSRIPFLVKCLYTAYMAVLIPVYWKTYGPTNFLYFCDIALIMTLFALWLESALLVSAAAVGIVLPQALWAIDFIATGIGWPLSGMTGYMYDDALPVHARFLSFFHFWLPFFLLWLLRHTGYDPKGLPLWTVIALVAVYICYFFLPAPPAPANNPGLPVNVNYVFGFSDQAAQTWMPPLVWFFLLQAMLVGLIFLPSHWLLKRLYHPAIK
ncbi:hypothetical protein [Fluviibacter phosphoraccumulans]|jgi:hypothetical protein|uniref:hypothetical protein n=1 Tax=Fluviibacter phosphoraccumulans TaxID=1751046 RepID=UPI0024E1F6E9|nr:hypothetical protein [Fluviibacter phosphoraccumulans]